MREHKIVVLGAMGSGKTTLVRALAGSGAHVVDTDVANSDRAAGKAATTVAMDYADIALPNGDRLRLYGTPGQQRFDFVWPVLLQGARGVLLLANASQPAEGHGLGTYLQALERYAPDIPAVVALTHVDRALELDLPLEAAAVSVGARALPVLPADARAPEQVLLLLDMLMAEIEAMEMCDDRG